MDTMDTPKSSGSTTNGKDWQDEICIHELRFGECALCSTSDWHEGVINNSDDLLVRALERIAAQDHRG
jgi:hypothetical protein